MTREEAERIAARLVTVVCVGRSLDTNVAGHDVLVAGYRVDRERSGHRAEKAAVRAREAIVRMLTEES